jgi:hypothetical protein
MSQNIPVVRQLPWKGLTPQLIVIAALVFVIVVYLGFPKLGITLYFLVALWVYFIFCRIMRAIFMRDNKSGKKAIQSRKFQDAISHFESSYRFF